MAKVENVIVEMENGNLPNAVMENIESKIDERLPLSSNSTSLYTYVFNQKTCCDTKKVASVRIHVQRVIGLVFRKFRIRGSVEIVEVETAILSEHVHTFCIRRVYGMHLN